MSFADSKTFCWACAFILIILFIRKRVIRTSILNSFNILSYRSAVSIRTWASMERHSSLFFILLLICVSVHLPSTISFIASRYLFLGLPLSRLPSIFPAIHIDSKLPFLSICPTNFSCLLRILVISSLLVFTLVIISLFFTLWVHETFSILLHILISIASSLLLDSLFIFF